MTIKQMTDAEWAALPVDVRVWAIEQARDTLARSDSVLTTATLTEMVRMIAGVLVKQPRAVAPPAEETMLARNFREERGLV